LLIRDSAVLNRLSNSCGPGASTEGEQRNRCWTLQGAMNEARKRISASWRPTRQSLSTALERPWHRSDQKSFKTLPGNSGVGEWTHIGATCRPCWAKKTSKSASE